jgi:hypothetical protein
VLLVWGDFAVEEKGQRLQFVIWRATVDEDGQYSFAVAL